MVQSAARQQLAVAMQREPHGLNPAWQEMPHECALQSATPFVGIGQSVGVQH